MDFLRPVGTDFGPNLITYIEDSPAVYFRQIRVFSRKDGNLKVFSRIDRGLLEGAGIYCSKNCQVRFGDIKWE